MKNQTVINAEISKRIIINLLKTNDLKQSWDMVLGDGSFDKFNEELYFELKNKTEEIK